MTDELTAELQRQLGATDGRTAFELSRALVRAGHQTDTGTVAKLLIRQPRLFRKDRATPPRWFLNPTANLEGLADRSPRPFLEALPPLYAWQQEALEAWRAQEGRGVIEAVTGAGKTLVGIAAVRDTVAAGRSAVVLVPSTPLLEQWESRLRDALPGTRVALVGAGRNDSVDRVDVVVSTVQTAGLRRRDLLPRDPELLVADECHRYGAETFSFALLPEYRHRLGLTATFARGDDGLTLHLGPFFGDVCFRLGYERALAEEVIAPFSIALVGVALDPYSREVYEENHEIAKQCMGILIHRHGLPEEPFGRFLSAVTELAREGSTSPLHILARRYLAAFKEYRRALAETPVKVEALQSLVPAIQEAAGTLVFTDSIQAAEASNRLLNASGLRSRALHSEVPLAERSMLLDRFRRRRLDVIVAPRVLDEGIDVPDADLGIIVAASRTRRQMVQRMGRVIRRKPDGRGAHFVILYAIGTTEDPATGAHETFLEEATTVASGTWNGTLGDVNGCLAFLSRSEAGTHLLPLSRDPYEPSRGSEAGGHA